MNIYTILILLGSIQGLILASLLLSRSKSKKKSNFYLALFIIAFSLSNLHYVAMIVGVLNRAFWFVHLSFPWSLLIPPAFYYFVHYLVLPNHKFKTKDRWFFIPFIFQTIFHLFLFSCALFAIEFIKQQSELIEQLSKIETILAIVMNFIFIPIIYFKIVEYEKSLKDNYSEISKSSLSWLKKLIIGLIVVWVLWAAPAIYQICTNITTPNLDYLLWILMSVVIYWIGYAMYFRSELFQAKEYFPSKDKQLDKPKLSDKTDEYYNTVIQLMERDKLYTNPDFDLSMLAAKCDIGHNYLSQIINGKAKKNFYEFVNSYRIEEVKTQLLDPENDKYSILGIGLDAGFKSKSSFYNVFKKHTGMTPSQFRNIQREKK